MSVEGPDPRTLPAYLRSAGLELSPAEVALAVRALAAFPGSLDAAEAVRRLRVVLARDLDAWRALPGLIAAWRRGEAIERVSAPEGVRGRPTVRRRDAAKGMGGGAGAWRNASDGAAGAGDDGAPGADAVELGPSERAATGVFGARAASGGAARPGGGGDDGRALAEVVARYARATQPRPRRRLRRAARGRVDPGGTWRRSLGTRGEPLRIVRAGRPLPPARRALLVDVSASMGDDAFAATLARALTRAPAGVEVRAFARDLLPGRWPRATAQAGGGTRIGHSLMRYLRGPGRSLGPHSHVMILSDGWETGDIAVLARALAVLVRRAGRVDWLSPLAGTPGFEPTCRGLATALALGIGVYDVHDTRSFARYVARLEAGGVGAAAVAEVGGVG